jgi:hypothetical protein
MEESGKLEGKPKKKERPEEPGILRFHDLPKADEERGKTIEARLSLRRSNFDPPDTDDEDLKNSPHDLEEK